MRQSHSETSRREIRFLALALCLGYVLGAVLPFVHGLEAEAIQSLDPCLEARGVDRTGERRDPHPISRPDRWG